LNWLNADAIIANLGNFAVWGVAIIIFLETATIFGSFLPGDSLLFLLGLSLATLPNLEKFPFALSLLIVFVAAVIGSEVGYWLGKRIGPHLFERRSTWFFNAKTVERTQDFFVRYGARAIILARFIPVLRALVPMFVGISHFEWKRFLRYNLIGGFGWVVGVMNLGYWLGQITWVHDNLEVVVLSFVVLSSLPLPVELLINYLKRRKHARTVAAGEAQVEAEALEAPTRESN
jgi:membrane-associated protein